MAMTQGDPAGTGSQHTGIFNAIIIGVGFSGLYQLHALRDRLGLLVCVFMPYAGGMANYAAICERVAADGYLGFQLRR